MRSSRHERQTKINEFNEILQLGIIFDERLPRLKLSEKIIKKRMEKQGWIMWRGGAINILRNPYDEIYPNVRKKYELLYTLLEKYHPGTLEYLQYLCAVHHGMPDYLCFKDGKFKFIECKLSYEQLLPGQKKCIAKLKDLGFDVELHKLIESQTKTIKSWYNLSTGRREVIEKQAMIED